MSFFRSRPLACFALLSLVAAAACGGDDESSSSSDGGSSADGGGGSGGSAMGGMAGGGMGGEAGMGGEGGTCENQLPNLMQAPALLSDTGLYSDIAAKTLSPLVQQYTPQFTLWSDAAVKTRWVYLPECGLIDNVDEDNWDFPVGTRMWKQFVFNGMLIETRFIHRYGPEPGDFVFASYAWDGSDNDAALVDPINGMLDAKGTVLDIPNEDQCRKCHGPHDDKGGTPSRYLGFGAIQLSHAGSNVTMATLSADGVLTVPNAAGYSVPGDATEQAALGYLHANCGNCHNDTANGIVYPFFDTRIKAGDATVGDTATYTTVVNQTTDFFIGYGCNYRIAGQSVADSCMHLRMGQRGDDVTPNPQQMPPLGTDVVDDAGRAVIEAWIGTLPTP